MYRRRTVCAFVCESPAAYRVRQEAGCTSGVKGQVGSSFSRRGSRVSGSSCNHRRDEVATEEGPTPTLHHYTRRVRKAGSFALLIVLMYIVMLFLSAIVPP